MIRNIAKSILIAIISNNYYSTAAGTYEASRISCEMGDTEMKALARHLHDSV